MVEFCLEYWLGRSLARPTRVVENLLVAHQYTMSSAESPVLKSHYSTGRSLACDLSPMANFNPLSSFILHLTSYVLEARAV